MNRRKPRHIAVAAALPTALAIILYGILAALGTAPGDLLPSLAIAALVLGVVTYIRSRGGDDAIDDGQRR